MIAHDRFDVGRVDVLAARQDHVLLAIDDVEEAFVVEAPDVAGAQPAAAMRVDPRRLLRRVGPLVIALHDQASVARRSRRARRVRPRRRRHARA